MIRVGGWERGWDAHNSRMRITITEIGQHPLCSPSSSLHSLSTVAQLSRSLPPFPNKGQAYPRS